MQHRTATRTAFTAAALVATIFAAAIGTTSSAAANAAGTVKAPVGNVGSFKQTFVQNFATAAAKGKVASTYAKSWQPYPDAGMYSSGTQISVHNGYMDVTLDGKHGAAGTFGTPTGAWTHKGGKFTVRAKATGGTGNGAAFMLWPTSNVWSDGEIDYPESNFESAPMLHQHSMVKGQEANADSFSTGTSWRSWHTYSIEWVPGKEVRYRLDGKIIKRITRNVPKTAHRYMFQVGNWGASGHLMIDYVTTYAYTG